MSMAEERIIGNLSVIRILQLYLYEMGSQKDTKYYAPTVIYQRPSMENAFITNHPTGFNAEGYVRWLS